MQYDSSTETEETKEIFLYTHWRGTELPETLRQGLIQGKSRWNDSPYLARVLFCAMVKEGGDEEGLADFGISPWITDNEYPLLVVDTDKKKVRVEDADSRRTLKTFSFASYIKTSRKKLWAQVEKE